MSWFKLVGSTEDPLPEDWTTDRADLLTEIRFPWNKPPSDIWSPGQLILYAVGSGVLVAVQRVDGPPQLRPRRGPAGSPENRWPHALAVVTEWVCSPVSTAPRLRDVAPEFAATHARKFRNGSHWKITDAEYTQLANVITGSGSASLT